jgi:hypothetical protein
LNAKPLVETVGNIINQKANIYYLAVATVAEINIIGNDDMVVNINNLQSVIDNNEEVFSENDLMVFYNALNNYLSEH